MTPAPQALPGVSYSLPMLQYDLSVTRTLVGCPTQLTFGKETATDAGLGFKIEATGVGDYVPGEVYLIDYEQLSSWFKTSTFALERHPNGTLKSLNAAATDQTGEVVKDVVKTGILVSAIGAGGPIQAKSSALASAQAVSAQFAAATKARGRKPLDQKGKALQTEALALAARSSQLDTLVAKSLETTKIVKCQPHALAATRARTENRDESKAKTAEVTVLNRKIVSQTTLANLKALDVAGRKALGTLFDQQEAVIAAQVTLDEALVEIDKPLAVKAVLTWPDSFSAPRQKTLALTDEQRDKLANLLVLDSAAKVLNPKTFEKELRRTDPADRLSLIKAYPKELATFLDPYGGVKEQAAPLKPCMGPEASIVECLKAAVRVNVALVRDEPGRDACPKAPRPAPRAQAQAESQARLAAVLADRPRDEGAIDEDECLREVDAADQEAELRAAAMAPRSAREGPRPPPQPKGLRITRARDPIADPGIFVRDPARARLVMCQAEECKIASKNLVTTVDTAYAPQVGQLRFLPFQNGLFESNALTVVVGEDGKVQKVEYKRDKAVAQVMAATAADVAGQVRAEQKRLEQEAKDDIAYQRTERAAARTEAAAIRTENAAILGEPGALLQARIDLLTKQAALKKLETPETPSEYVKQDEEIARLTKETAVLTARRLRQEAIAAAEKLGVPID